MSPAEVLLESGAMEMKRGSKTFQLNAHQAVFLQRPSTRVKGPKSRAMRHPRTNSRPRKTKSLAAMGAEKQPDYQADPPEVSGVSSTILCTKGMVDWRLRWEIITSKFSAPIHVAIPPVVLPHCSLPDTGKIFPKKSKTEGLWTGEHQEEPRIGTPLWKWELIRNTLDVENHHHRHPSSQMIGETFLGNLLSPRKKI